MSKKTEAEAVVKKTVEQWRDEKLPSVWKHAAAAAHNAWPVGKELTSEEYDAALERAATIPIH